MKTNFLNIHDLVLIFTSLECLVLALLLKILPSKRPQPRLILAAFFVLIACVLTTTVMVWNGDLREAPINHTPYMVAALVFCLLLEGPVLFFYLRSLSKKVRLLRLRHTVHLVPALLAVIIVLSFHVTSLDWQQNIPVPQPEKLAISLVWAMVKMIPVFYLFASVWAEYKLREDLKQLYSDISQSELKLADAVLLGFCVHFLWSMLHYALDDYISVSLSDQLGIINNYLSVILVNGLFVFGLINTRQLLSSAAIASTQPVVVAEVEADTKLAPKIAAIEKGIHEQKLYLESNINLERFAEQIGLRPRDTSAVLKAHYQVNFFEFINGYRVEEAKLLLASPEYKNETILELIYKSGFNSPSAFHRFFKRIVGMTPTEYRKQASGIES